MTDNRTLDEIQADDWDNYEFILKDAQIKRFPHREKAYAYQRECVVKALEMMGIPKSDVMAIEVVDGMLELYNVRMESLRHKKFWRDRGLAIYKLKDDSPDPDEMAFFISEVKMATQPAVYWGVMANVPLDGGKIYSFPSIKPGNC